MLVCGHGNVSDFCNEHSMVIVNRHFGEITEYVGVSRVVVTDMEMLESEYVLLKSDMLKRGYELVSTRHTDTEQIARLVAKLGCESKRSGGRSKFGFTRINGEQRIHPERMKVVRRIFELHDKGYTLRKIQEDECVHHGDGRKLSLSTIQLIIGNRKEYEK